jgi:hypothetical protein
MKTFIYCKPTAQGLHTFYLVIDNCEYFLFNQSYRKGVQNYFGKGVRLEQSRKYSKTNNDAAIIKTMNKLPMYIKYIEKEYDICVLEQTKKKTKQDYYKSKNDIIFEERFN